MDLTEAKFIADIQNHLMNITSVEETKQFLDTSIELIKGNLNQFTDQLLLAVELRHRDTDLFSNLAHQIVLDANNYPDFKELLLKKMIYICEKRKFILFFYYKLYKNQTLTISDISTTIFSYFQDHPTQIQTLLTLTIIFLPLLYLSDQETYSKIHTLISSELSNIPLLTEHFSHVSDPNFSDVHDKLIENRFEDSVIVSILNDDPEQLNSLLNGDHEVSYQVDSKSFLHLFRPFYLHSSPSIFHYACFYGSIQCVSYFLSKSYLGVGLNISLADAALHTPAMFAAASGSVPVMNLLREHNANLSLSERTALMFHQSNPQLLPNISDFSFKDKYGFNYLHTCAETNNISGLLSCLSSENLSDPSLPSNFNNYKWSALHTAARKGHLECFRLLLSKCSDPEILNVLTSSGSSIFHMAAESPDPSLTSFLFSLITSNAVTTTSSQRFHIEMKRDKNGNYPTHVYSINDRPEHLKAALDSGIVDANSRGKGQYTAYHFAAENGNPSIIKVLLSHLGVNLNASLPNGTTPLHLACYNGRTEVVRVMVQQKGLDVKAKAYGDTTALHHAAGRGYPEIISLLLTTINIQVNALLNNGSTPLHLAAGNNHKDAILALLKSPQIDPNIDFSGETPLHLAAMRGYADVIKALLSSHLTNPDPLDGKSQTPLFSAARNGHLDAVKAFLEYNHSLNNVDLDQKISENQQQQICENNYCEECKNNITNTNNFNTNNFNTNNFNANNFNANNFNANNPNSGNCNNSNNCNKEGKKNWKNVKININTQDLKGWTSLHWAACHGYTEIVNEFLKEKEINVNVKTSRNSIPLHFAVSNEQYDTVSLLLKRNDLELDVRDSDGFMPLYYALCYRDPKMTKVLLDSGRFSQIINNPLDDNGKSAIHLVAERNDGKEIEIMKYLLELNEIDINKQDSHGETTLHISVLKKNINLVDLLLKEFKLKRCDIQIKDNTGLTPLEIAENNHDDGIIQIFKQY